MDIETFIWIVNTRPGPHPNPGALSAEFYLEFYNTADNDLWVSPAVEFEQWCVWCAAAV